MKNSYQIVILLLAALVAAFPFECPLAPTITVTFGTMNAVPALSTITSAPETSSEAIGDLNNHIIIAVTNIYGNYLSLSFGLNAGGPSPVGNPSPTKLANNAFT